MFITNYFTGHFIGDAFATIAPPMDWLNEWLANNAPICMGKNVWMDGGGGKLGHCHNILDSYICQL